MRFLNSFSLQLLLSILIGAGTSTLAQKKEERLLTFEGDGFKDWKVEGKAFGLGPSVDLPAEVDGIVRHFCEDAFGCSAAGGVAAQGALVSPEITLKMPFISFRIGGSKQGCGVEMLADDEVVLSVTPLDNLTLQRVTWDITPWVNHPVRFRFFDETTEGFLLVDHLFSHPNANPIFPNSTRNGKLYEPGLKHSPILPGLLIPEESTARIFANHKTDGVTSPTALTVAEDGKIYLSESNRFRFGVFDNRGHLYWVLDDIASTSVDDRRALHEKWQHELPLEKLTEKSEAIRWLQDSNQDGRADQNGVFATGFDDLLDGTAAGVFSYQGVVYFACIPNIWALSDFDGDGKVGEEEKLVLQDGFGVRVSLSGHDLNGFALGPDGRLYGSIGDRGLQLTTSEGTNYSLTDQGAAFRFEPDGSGFEIFHTGLRNPKEIAFNEVGDAFSVDNNADLGDQARLVYLVDGADSGWRTDHQTLQTFHRQIGLPERPLNRWLDEHMWNLAQPGQPAWILPPIAHFTNGPSGLAFQPGTALGGQFENQFFICDYKGGPAASGIYHFGVERNGSSYRKSNTAKFIWGLGATDLDFGFNGNVYISDFVTGWKSEQQGRVISLTAPEPHPQATEVAQLVSEGFPQRTPEELMSLLSHPDQRVRLRAQLALAEKPEALPSFYSQLHLRNQLLDLPPENLLLPPLDFDDELRADNTPAARLHATWGLAILARKNKDPYATTALVGLLKSSDPELRAQAAKALGETPVKDPSRLIEALQDPSDRVRFFAALSLGRLRITDAFEPLLQLGLQAADRDDVYLRHAVVVGLSGCASEQELHTLSGHALPPMRMLSLLALHRLQSTGVNRFLFDHTPAIRNEAIRIIHDTPIEAARPALIPVLDEFLAKENTSTPPLIWQRLIHSTFRLSGPENATRLMNVAESNHAPLTARREALRLLLQWTEPFPVDQSLGRFAPLGPRPLADVLPLLESRLAPLLSPENPLIIDAIALVAHYPISPTSLKPDTLLGLVDNQKIPAEARVTALTILAKNKDFTLTPILIKTLESRSFKETPSLLRLKALSLLTERQPEQSFSFLSQALTSPNLDYRQGAAIQLATHPHPEVPLLVVSYFDRLREKDNPDHTIELEMTIAAQVSAHHASHEALKAYQNTLGDDPLLPFLDTLQGGIAARGKSLFASHPAAQCSRCHARDPKVKAEGMAGPHLSDIGKNKRRYLLEALVQPSATISPGFAPVTLELKNGETLAGPLLSQTEEHLDLLVDGKALRVAQEDLTNVSEPISSMPAMDVLLQKEEIRDLIAYLSTLKKSPETKKPLAQEPKRYHPSVTPTQSEMADETTPTPAPAENATPAAASLPEGVDQATWDLGKTTFVTCSACHGPEGKGVAGLGPPFEKSEWVTGPTENLIRIQLRGLQGPITVNGIDYNPAAPMGPLSFQSDEQIAAVLTYVRNSFGNEASAVKPAEVAEWREKELTSPPKPMLTAEDLKSPFPEKVEGGGSKTIELAKPVTADMPKAESYVTFPYLGLALIFLLVVAVGTAKFLFSKS